jgi:small-conductance mechanosensitive channel/CRP-like cAMP-binding protein
MKEPIFIFGAALAVDTALSWFVPQDRRVARLGFASFFFLVYSFLIVAHLGSPLHPVITGGDLPHRLLLQLLFCVWWGAAARETVLLFTLPAALNRATRKNEILFDILATSIYVCAGVAALTVVFKLPVQGLVATSGVLAIVLGLALQNSLGDVFSGLALSVEKPFQIGDQVRLEGGLEGKVIKINWRATYLLNDANDLVVIPHSVMAKMQIQNRTALDACHTSSHYVAVDSRNEPDFVKEVLKQAAMTCAAVVEHPSPSVMAVNLGGKQIRYKINFSMASIELEDKARSQLIAQIYRRARPLRGIAPTGPLHFFGEESLLDHLELFAPLSAEEKKDLNARMMRRHFQTGEKLVVQGTALDSIQYVFSGVVQISHKLEDGREVKIKKLGPGDSFGALSLLTGSPTEFTLTALTSGLLLGLCSADLKPLITSRPELAEALSRMAARLRQYLDDATEQDNSLEPTDILSRIKNFFQLDK